MNQHRHPVLAWEVMNLEYAGNAADRSLHGQRAGPCDGLSAAAFSATLHAGRHRVAGLGR